MPRRLSPLLLAVLVALLAPAAAHAAWFPGEALDGPSADVVAVDDLDIARDGTGAVVWRRVVDGTPHVFVSRLAGGAWRPAERLDTGILEGAEEAAVGVADGGRVAVAWVSGSRVFGAFAPAGTGLQPFAGPTLVGDTPGAPSSGLDLDMGINGTAFAVWRGLGAGGADVLAARLKGTTWSPVSGPLDIAASNAAGADTGRPRVAVDAAGTPLVVWGENGGVFARRVIGLAPSQYPAAVSLPDLGPADLPEVDVEEDGSFGWVAFRQRDPNGPRALARRIRGLAFDQPFVLDTGAGAGPPRVSINGRGSGAAVVPAGGGAVLFDDVLPGNVFSAPGRVDTQGGDGLPDVGLAESDSRDLAVAWRRPEGEAGGSVLARYRPSGKPWEDETLLSPPDFGPVAPGSLHVGANRNGDVAVAMLQGGPADHRVVVASYDLPPGRAFPSAAGGWVKESEPVLRWLGGNDLWGLDGYQVLIDGAVAGTIAGGTKALQAPAPLADGTHTMQVITVDRRGQAVPSGVRKFNIDTVLPTATLGASGSPRKGRPVRVQVTAADTGSGVAAVAVDYGDRTKRGTAADTVHRWARPGSYTITATVADRAGNAATATATVRIRR